MSEEEVFRFLRDNNLYHADCNGNVWTRRVPGAKKSLYDDRWVLVETYVSREYHGFKWKNRSYYLHRFVCWWHHGSIPHEYEVDHIDGDINNRHPSNLEAVTKAENQRRKWARHPELRISHSNIFRGRKFNEETRNRMSNSARKRHSRAA